MAEDPSLKTVDPSDKHIIDEDPSKFGKKIKPVVDSLGKNNGEFVPTALKMIENLKSVAPGQNPTMVNAVGAQSLAAAQKAVAAIFANNAANTDPCSIPRAQQTEEQIGECACAVPEAQRTAQQEADCLFWTHLQEALTANTVEPDVANTVPDTTSLPLFEVLTANRTYNITTTGNNATGDGLTSAKSWLTLQYAWDTIVSSLDLSGFLVTIQMGDGTYADNFTPALRPVGGSIMIQGNTANHAAVIITGGWLILNQGTSLQTQFFTLPVQYLALP